MALFSNAVVRSHLSAREATLWDTHLSIAEAAPEVRAKWTQTTMARGDQKSDLPAWLYKISALLSTPFTERTLFLDIDVFVIWPNFVDTLLGDSLHRIADLVAPMDVGRYLPFWRKYVHSAVPPFCSAVMAYSPANAEMRSLLMGAAKLMIGRHGKALPGTPRLGDQEVIWEEWTTNHPGLRVVTLAEEWYCPQRRRLASRWDNSSERPEWSTGWPRARYPCKALHGHDLGDPDEWPVGRWAGRLS